MFFTGTYGLELLAHDRAMRGVLGDSCSPMCDDGCAGTEDVLWDLSEPVKKLRKQDLHQDHLLPQVPMFSEPLLPLKNLQPVAADCTSVSALWPNSGND